MSAYERTLFLLRRRGGGRGAWQRLDGTYWMDDRHGVPSDATELITPLISADLLVVDTGELPIGRGPHRGGRWLKLTRAGRQALADAARREENALPEGAEHPYQHEE